MHQEIEAHGNTLVVKRPNRPPEEHSFRTAEEADRRRRFIEQGLTWVGTPFRDLGAIKGRKGAVDCAMLLARSAIDAGLMAEFDPRSYSPRWHLHRRRELFIEWLEKLGAKEVPEPKLGDVVVWIFGKTFSHGAILVNSEEVVHAYYASGVCLVSRLDESLLRYVSVCNVNFPRPVKYFSLWSD